MVYKKSTNLKTANFFSKISSKHNLKLTHPTRRLTGLTDLDTRPQGNRAQSLTSDSDRETIRRKSLEPGTKSKLRDQHLGIGVLSPQEHREPRKALYPLSKREEERGKRTSTWMETYVTVRLRDVVRRNVQKYDLGFFHRDMVFKYNMCKFRH